MMEDWGVRMREGWMEGIQWGGGGTDVERKMNRGRGKSGREGRARKSDDEGIYTRTFWHPGPQYWAPLQGHLNFDPAAPQLVHSFGSASGTVSSILILGREESHCGKGSNTAPSKSWDTLGCDSPAVPLPR